jgi:hypothetical protein
MPEQNKPDCYNKMNNLSLAFRYANEISYPFKF